MARAAWDRYWEGTANPPKSVTYRQSSCPNVAFAMSMVKQLLDLNLIRDDLRMDDNGDLTIAGLDATDSAIMLAGAYNSGTGSFADHCGGAKTLAACIASYSSKHETHKHMVSLERCAKRDSVEPMVGWPKRKCEDFKSNI